MSVMAGEQVKHVVEAWLRSLGFDGLSKPFYDGIPWLVNIVLFDTYLLCNDKCGRYKLFYADPRLCDKMEALLETGIMGD